GGFWPLKRRFVLPWLGCCCQRTVVFGLYSTAFFCIASVVICRSAVTSRIHRLRPCVAATISPAVGWTAISCTATVGRLLFNFVHEPPRSRLTKTANSVPAYSRAALW